MALVPKINLRLTNEEHEALKAWAQDSRRSIQREAVFRLFSERSLSERDVYPSTSQDGTQLAASLAPRSESGFKGPDFK